MKENNAKFDDYVKKLLNQEEDLGVDFDWENMDIEVPKKKRKRRFLFLLIFGGLLGCTAMLYFYFNNAEITKVDDYKTVNENNLEREQLELEILENEKKLNDQNKKIASLDQGVSELKEEIEDLKQSNFALKQGISKSLESDKNQTAVNAKFSWATAIQANSQSITSNYNESPSNVSETNAQKTNVTLPLDFEQSEIENEVNNNVNSDVKSKFINILNSFQRKIAPLDQPIRSIGNPDLKFNLFDNEKNESFTKNLFPFIQAGIVMPIINKTDEVDNIYSSELNKSINVGLQFNVRRNLRLNLSAKYTVLHTSFRYRRLIEREAVQASVVNTFERTYHNNFVRAIGIEGSIAKKFDLSNNFYVDFSGLLGINQISSNTGKTLLDDNIVLIEDQDISNGVKYYLGSGIHINRNFAKKISLSVGYSVFSFLGNEIIVSDDYSIPYYHQVSLGLSLKI